MNKEKSYKKIYIAWGAVALFFFYQYILRLSVGMMESDLRTTFKMTAEHFSTLGSYYLYAYALLQIPMGILVDKIGVRRVVMGSVAVCIGAIFMFSQATELWMIQLSRVLLGGGSACAYMSGLKIAADYLTAGGKRGLLMGCTLAAGTMGAFLGTQPFLYLLENYHWREALQWVMVPGVLLMVLVTFCIPKGMKSVQHQSISLKDLSNGLKGVFSNYKLMMYAVLAIGVYTPLATIPDLWGPAFLETKYGFGRTYASTLVTLLYVGMAVGSFLITWIADRRGKLNQTLKICSISTLIIFALFLYGSWGNFSLILLLGGLGFLCGAEATCFAGASRHTHAGNSGLVLGFVNTLNMLGAALLQKFVGVRMDSVWRGVTDTSGVRVYAVEEYMTGLSLLTVVLGICAVVALFLKSESSKNINFIEGSKNSKSVLVD